MIHSCLTYCKERVVEVRFKLAMDNCHSFDEKTKTNLQCLILSFPLVVLIFLGSTQFNRSAI